MASVVEELRARVDRAEKRAEAAEAESRRPRADAEQVFGTPWARKGQDTMSSKPIRFINVLGLACGLLKPEQATIEYHALDAFRKSMHDSHTGLSQMGDLDRSFIYPSSFKDLPHQLVTTDAARNLKSMIAAGSYGYDPDEVAWIASRSPYFSNPSRQDSVALAMRMKANAPLSPAQSYLDDSLGGTLVAPPVQGELIPLMRNMSFMDRAGCQQVALPPQGKMVFPRQATASTAYWITENTTITLSQITTGQMVLEAKKLGVAFIVPNDLFKFSSASADALIQADGAKSMALTMDAAGLYGSGNGQPKGLNKYTGSNEVYDYSLTNPKGIGTNGNIIYPEDAEYMLGAIEDRNFDVDAGFRWVMRGSMWRRLAAVRADAVTSGDEAGPMLAILSLIGDKVGNVWKNMPVIRSAQVLGNITKGTATNCSEIWGGMWNECVMAMYGAVEFARGPGEQAFLADQTIIRGILYGDVGFRYPGSFVHYPQVLPRFQS